VLKISSFIGSRYDHRLGLDYQTVDELKGALDALPGP
jgi:hypothetical protein